MHRPKIAALTGALALAATGCGGGHSSPPMGSGPGPGGEATHADIAGPEALVLDEDGNLYVSEFSGAAVDKITPDGTLMVVAGTGSNGFSGDGGPAVKAELNDPAGIFLEPDGRLLIADHHNDLLREVDPAGVITTVRGSTDGALDDPIGIVRDRSGALYVADELHARIVRIDPAGKLTVVAGGGNALPGDGGRATDALLSHPSYVLIDAAGNLLFSDFLGNRIRKVDQHGVITTIAGTGLPGFSGDGGPATAAALNLPTGLALDAAGNLYVSDADNNRVRRIGADGVITTVAGNGAKGFGGDGGPARSALFNAPAGLALDAAGNLYIADQGNNRVRRVDTHGVITTVAGR